jgi:hypothetical protein
VVFAYSAYWRVVSAAEFGNRGIAAIHNHPAQACACGRTCDLRESSIARRLEDQCADPGGMVLNHLQQLLALLNGIVVGIKDFKIHVQSAGALLSGIRLFPLIVAFPGNERERKNQLRRGFATSAASFFHGQGEPASFLDCYGF